MTRKAPIRSAKRAAKLIPPKAHVPRPAIDFTRKESAVEGETFAEKLLRKTTYALENDKPHFRIGERQVFFPYDKVTLLRPNAKHTPYQAKFIVPRDFNKLDLRDYLWNVYGLRALNVTTQLLWARWTREHVRAPRYRETQIKKMTIDMPEPFVWPEPTTLKQQRSEYQISMHDELSKYSDDIQRVGSDKLKPPTSFGGLVGPYAPVAEPFVAKKVAKQMKNIAKKSEKQAALKNDEQLMKDYLGL